MKGEKKIIGCKIVKVEKFDEYMCVYLDNGMGLEVSDVMSVKNVNEWLDARRQIGELCVKSVKRGKEWLGPVRQGKLR